MFRKRLIGIVFAGALAFSAAAADVVIRLRPPIAIVEHRGAPPSRDHVWVNGYHRWDGNAYVWTAGSWQMPPQPHQRWVAHHYVRRNGGYVLVDGRWR
jgi:hypothetical protein